MMVLFAGSLTPQEMRGLSTDLVQELAEEKWALSKWHGRRPPEGYVCSLPSRLTDPVLRAAVRYVLDQIDATHVDDALRLEERVLGVVPFGMEVDEWFGVVRAEPSQLGVWLCLMPGRCASGWICLNEEAGMDFDAACLVFAHECGHAVSRGTEWRGGHVPCAKAEWLDEADANQFVIEWGFGKQLRRAKANGQAFITFDDLRTAGRGVCPCSTREVVASA